MVLIEFRIPMPLSVEEFHRGQLYMVAQKSLELNEGDEGVEWIKNEPFDNTDGHWGTSPITNTPVPRTKGQYTLKRYHVKSKLPGIVTTFAPSNSLYLLEESWNAYPHCKTVIVNGYLSKDKFKIDVETMHVADNCTVENVLNLGPVELKERKVIEIDIREAYADTKAKDYNPKYNASIVKSEKTGRGPLVKGWEKAGPKPMLCAYKVVRATWKYMMSGTIEEKITSSQKNLFGQTLAQAFTTLDEWTDKTMEDIRGMEEEVARRSAATVARLKAKGEAPDIPELDYHLRTAAAAGAAAGGAGAKA